MKQVAKTMLYSMTKMTLTYGVSSGPAKLYDVELSSLPVVLTSSISDPSACKYLALPYA
jgi:hypothetical protein